LLIKAGLRRGQTLIQKNNKNTIKNQLTTTIAEVKTPTDFKEAKSGTTRWRADRGNVA
jgi:hypothetical protein